MLNKINLLIVAMIAMMSLIFTAPQAADLSSRFTYQGELKSGPVPVNGQADFRVTLWDALTSGSQIGLGNEIVDVPVVNGVFQMHPNFTAAVFDGQRRWIEIEVQFPSGDGGFVPLSPRQEITATPYALQTRGLFVDQDKLVGVGTTSPAAALHVFKSNSSPAADAVHITTDGASIISRRTLTISGGSINVEGLFGTPVLSLMNTSSGNVTIGSGGGDVTLSSGAGQTLVGGQLASFPSSAECFVNGNFEVRKENTAGVQFIPTNSFVEMSYRKGGTTIVLAHLASGFTSFGASISVNKFSAPDYPIHVGTGASNGNGAHVTNGGIWTNGSDENSKTDYTAIDKRAILDKVAALPVTQWRYKGEPEDVKHIGPTAQDFMAAFGLGESDRHIGTVDEIGVALAAIQALDAKVKEQEAALERQSRIIERLEQHLKAYERE